METIAFEILDKHEEKVDEEIVYGVIIESNNDIIVLPIGEELYKSCIPGNFLVITAESDIEDENGNIPVLFEVKEHYQ